MTNKLLTTAEVAEILSVPTTTLGQWAYLGHGPAFSKVGKHRRYDPADLEEWMKSLPTGGAAKPTKAA